MQAVREKISLASLRALIGQTDGTRKRETLSCLELDGGIPRGAITEISGPARTEFVVRFLAQNSSIQTAWIEEHLSILPTAIEQRKAALERIVFFEAKKEVDWTVGTVLRSKLFPIVVLTSDHLNSKKLRRYQLLSEKANACMILISEQPSTEWSIALQVEALRPRPDGPPKLRLLKKKG